MHAILMEMSRSAPKPSKRAKKTSEFTGTITVPKTFEGVEELLESFGFKGKAGKCAMKGLAIGKVKVDPVLKLETIVFEVTCENCPNELTVTLEQLLRQSDRGDDYEDGSEGGAVKCECGYGAYVANLCYPKENLEVDSGKFHNHCALCPGFGKHLGDYRMVHCSTCGHHFWAGGYGRCDRCDKSKGRNGFGFGYGFGDSDNDDSESDEEDFEF